MKYIFSLVFLLGLAQSPFAQISRYAPSAIRFGADPGTLGYMVFSKKRDFFELEADIDIDKFFLVTNYGVSSYQLEEETYSYENDGTYIKVGLDYNFMHKDPKRNIAFIGLRYAMADFKDKLDYNTETLIHPDTGWPATWQQAANSNARARWVELVTGLKVRIVNQLYMGFTLRYQLFMKVSQTEGLRPYYVPGFGKNINPSSFGFNYYVSYRIPFRKKTIYTEKEKELKEAVK